MIDKHLVSDDLSKLEVVLDEAQNDYAIDVESFRKTKIFKMGKFIRIYSELMNHLDVRVNDDVQEALEIIETENAEIIEKPMFKNRLEDFIRNWNNFLEKVEQNVSFRLIKKFKIILKP
jgi:hypothetical protein